MIVQPVQPASSCRQVVPRAAPVAWIVPDDSRDRGRLLDWCRTVGPVLVQSPESAEDGIDVENIAIVSWNVHVGGGDVEAVVTALRRGEMTDGVPVSHFVLLLQEAYRQSRDVPAAVPAGVPLPPAIVKYPPTGMRRDVRSIADAMGLYLFYAPAMRNHRAGLPEDRGAAILSTLPLADLHVIELPFERQRRVALAATVAGETPQGPWQLRLADIHVDTSLALTRGGPFAARKRQAEALVDALAGRIELLTVVGGDFNTWLGPEEPALGVMRHAFPETPDQSHGATWHGPFGIRATLDYVFVRGQFGSVSTRVLPDRFGSDHHPLLTLVTFSSRY